MKTILVPVDFSTVTRAVVAQAAQLAHSQQARIMLLHVVQPPAISSEYAPYLESVGEIVDMSRRSAFQHLKRLTAELRADDVPTELIDVVGAPAATIVKKAKALRAAYIVMGSHGHGAFYDLLVGSTTHGVLSQAPCVVVVVPSPRRRAGKRKAAVRRAS